MINTSSSIKLIALYFPQLHAIAENDAWWGKGFTDWDNVKTAQPLFKGHMQPRVPLNSDYYDQSNLEVIRRQAILAREYGIYGFCHYHYWFDGKQMLQTPTNLLLDNKDIDMPFCLSWANETWSRRWDGKDHHILIQQTHPPLRERWLAHFEYLYKAWSDERAIKIDDKPVFVIYRPQLIEDIANMLSYWNSLAIERGLKGVYFIFQKQYDCPDSQALASFDGEFQFQPFEAINRPGDNPQSDKRDKWRKRLTLLPKSLQNAIWSVWSSHIKGITAYNYEDVWQRIIDSDRDSAETAFSGAFVDWDNTARYGKRATLFKGASPARFGYWFDLLCEKVQRKSPGKRLIFINAWNEWAESAYLEPDANNGYAYLETIKEILQKYS